MSNRHLLAVFLTAGLSVAALGADRADAQSIACGQDYVIKPGDSLSAIARSAYGNTSNFQLIYSANASVIGSNPEIIEVGDVLKIPCQDATSQSVADNSAIRQTSTTEALPAPEVGKIRVVVGTDWAPFTNEDQEQGGLVTEITNVALSLAEGNPAYQIDFINDWGAHLQPLITDHAYDFSLAWFRPNCDVVDRLSDDSKFRCNNLDWSDPIFEQVVGYYTRKDEPRPASHTELFGKTICRPSGYATFMLEEVYLVEPNVKLEQPGATTDCFEGLVAGKYDVVVLAADTAEGAIAKVGVKDQVTFQDHLSYVATMHAVIAKTNPRGTQALAALNGGLREIKQNGEWFRIVMRHMAEHNRNVQ